MGSLESNGGAKSAAPPGEPCALTWKTPHHLRDAIRPTLTSGAAIDAEMDRSLSLSLASNSWMQRPRRREEIDRTPCAQVQRTHVSRVEMSGGWRHWP
jgi:hypothetical protein